MTSLERHLKRVYNQDRAYQSYLLWRKTGEYRDLLRAYLYAVPLVSAIHNLRLKEYDSEEQARQVLQEAAEDLFFVVRRGKLDPRRPTHYSALVRSAIFGLLINAFWRIKGVRHGHAPSLRARSVNPPVTYVGTMREIEYIGASARPFKGFEEVDEKLMAEDVTAIVRRSLQRSNRFGQDPRLQGARDYAVERAVAGDPVDPSELRQKYRLTGSEARLVSSVVLVNFRAALCDLRDSFSDEGAASVPVFGIFAGRNG